MEEHAEGVPAKFSSVWHWAARDVDDLREKSLSARVPEVAEYVNCIAQSFRAAHQLVLNAHADEPPPAPDSLALIFARIVEFDRRAAALVKSAPISDWPGTPGCSLAQFSGRSGLDVAISYSTAVYQALLFTFGYGLSGKRFPPYIEDMPLTGEGITDMFRGWPGRAYAELRDKTIPSEPVWMMRRDAERVWGAVELEYERYVDAIQSRLGNQIGPVSELGYTHRPIAISERDEGGDDSNTNRVAWNETKEGYIPLSAAISILRDDADRLEVSLPTAAQVAERLDRPGNPVRHMKRKESGGGRGNRRVLASDVLLHKLYLLGKAPSMASQIDPVIDERIQAARAAKRGR